MPSSTWVSSPGLSWAKAKPGNEMKQTARMAERKGDAWSVLRTRFIHISRGYSGSWTEPSIIPTVWRQRAHLSAPARLFSWSASGPGYQVCRYGELQNRVLARLFHRYGLLVRWLPLLQPSPPGW